MPNATARIAYSGSRKKRQSQATPGSASPAQTALPFVPATRVARARGQTPALNSAQAFCHATWPSGGQLRQEVAGVEVALADDRGLQVRGDDAILDQPVGIELGQRRLVADEVREVVVPVLHVEEVVDEVMREDGVLRRLRDRHQVVADRPLAVLREPEAERFGPQSLGQVPLRRDRAPRPGLVHPRSALREVRVVVGRELHVDRGDQRLELLLRMLDVRGVLRVDVLDPVLQEHVPGRVAAVVEEVRLAAVRLVPVDLVRVVEVERGRLQLVRAIPDARRPHQVRSRVQRALVVPRVLHRGPGVGEVRQVVVVQRLEDLAHDQAAEAVRHRDEDVVVDGAGRDLRDRLVHRDEVRLLDLDAVLLREVLLDPRPQVAVPVVDPERAALGLEAGRDRRVVVEELPRDRVVRARERELGGLAVRAAAAGREQRPHARQRERTRSGPPEELPPPVTRLSRMQRHRLSASEPESASAVNRRRRSARRPRACRPGR